MRAALRGLLVVATCAALAIAWTWPLATRLGTHYLPPHNGATQVGADQLFTSWILAWDARRLVRDPLRVFDSNNLHPFRRSLAFSENLLGLVPLVGPVQWTADNPVLTNNVATLAVLTLACAGMFLLVRALTGSAAAGLVGGLLLTYSPAEWPNVGQLHMLARQGTPFALWALVRLVQTRRARWTVLLGVCTAWQAWSSLHHGLFLALGLTASVATLVLLRVVDRRLLGMLLGAGALAVLLCLPLGLPYRAAARELEASREVRFVLFVSQLALPLGDPLGHLAARLSSGSRARDLMTFTPWLLLLGGVLAAAVPGRPRGTGGRLLAAVVVGGIVNLLFAFGPRRPFGTRSVFDVLAPVVPGIAVLRAPVRAVSYANIALCVVAACAFGTLWRRFGPRGRTALAVALVGMAVLETGWRPSPLLEAPGRRTPLEGALASLPDGCAVADLPADLWGNAYALFRTTTHWRPLVNGYSGYSGTSPWVTFWLLDRFPKDAGIRYLQEAGACAVIVRADADPRVLREARALGLAVETSGGETLVHVPAPPPAPAEAPLPRDGFWAMSARGIADQRVLDGDLDTFWQGAARGAFEPDRLVLDLGRATEVSAVELHIGRRFARHLVSYLVEGSRDGATWMPLARTPVAAPPLASYRADSRRVRQRIVLAPTTVRWLRIGPYRRAPGRGAAPDSDWRTWGAAELHVYGRVGH